MTKQIKTYFTGLEKVELFGMIIEAITGVAGASLILSEGHPYLALTFCALGAASSKVVNFIQKKSNENNSHTPNTADAP